jgi:hypothetical protein
LIDRLLLKICQYSGLDIKCSANKLMYKGMVPDASSVQRWGFGEVSNPLTDSKSE